MLIPILCKDFNSFTVGWKCMSSDIGVIFRNLQIGNFCFFCFFRIEFTLCCHNFIQNDIHDLMTFITNKQNTKRIWVGPFQFNLIKYF
jgi:hypothetical protein